MAAPFVPPSVLDPRTQAFPLLTEAQIRRIRAVSQPRQVRAGDVLITPEDSNVPFYVLLSGRMEIVQPVRSSGTLVERPIAGHGPGEFTGEVGMISGRRSLVTVRVTEDGEFLEMSGDAMRSLIARDAELSEIFMRAFILRRLALIQHGYGDIVLLGSRHSAATLSLREFLVRNGHPYTYMDLDTDKAAQDLLDRFSVKVDEVPVVICNTRNAVMRNPTAQKLADCLGLNASVDETQVRDLVIVGAGPSGLAAAVYAASEGLDALVIETYSPGGQAGSSSKIENYLGFPTGISGQELAARAIHQAEKFGAKMIVAHDVTRLDCGKRPYKVLLDDGNAIAARAVLIATGAQYNKPNLPNLARFEGQGCYYAATHMEGQLCDGEEIVVIGGGNSAGQAAVFLSENTPKVHILVRSRQLSDTMSRYLIQRIEENPKIEVHYQTEVVALDGDTHLERVTWEERASGQRSTRDIRHVFIMAGASPRTQWLQGCLALDDKGFILTGRDLNASSDMPVWPLTRSPYMLETSRPGVFAVGDVRSGNVKRVAAAVGEGSIAIHLIHRALAEP